jgi:eukaryotic-like serine/threonine-protein kinase
VPSWDHLKELFDEAVNLSADQRAAYLDKVCGDDAALRAELQRLLDADEQANSFMNMPAVKWTSSTESVSPAVFSAGEKVAGRFRIMRFLGQGGMGQVYQAEDEVLGGFVALKTIRPEIASDPKPLERFKQEVRLAKEVTHDNVCRIFDMDHHNAPPFITMEFLEGVTLGVRLHEGRMTTAEAYPLIKQIAEGLNAAHRKGIIHRDLKPGNIMLTPTGGDWQAKVMDFGLARNLEGDSTMASRKPMGTPGYMAPELFAGARATIASDIYAFGVVMFEMATGTRAAFDHSQPAPSPHTFVPSLDPNWEAAMLRCLERDPAKRPLHALDVVNQIGGKNGLVGWFHRHPLAVWAAVFSLLVVAIGLWAARNSDAEGETTYSQITTDSGLSSYPAISPDGRFMAYASDRSAEGNLDIWLRQIGGGDPIPLTRNPADDYDPTFSADGTKIAFRSERDGGGIYLVSTLGVEEQLLVRGGYGPRFSPDGNWIAYWVGLPGSGFIPGSSQVYVKPTNGGPAKALPTGLAATFWPVWAPDSKRLLVIGKPNTPEESAVSVDWWVVSLAGGRPIKASALSAFRAQHLAVPLGQNNIAPIAWFGENHVIFSAMSGDPTNLWEVTLSKAGKVISPARRRTVNTSMDLYASVIAEPNNPLRRMVFASLFGNVSIWSLPIDGDTGLPSGEMQKLTPDLSYAAAPSVSIDGRRLVFITVQSKIWSVRERDLATGRETTLASGDQDWFRPRISPDGGSVAYVDDNNHMYVVDTRTGSTEKICEQCGPPTEISDGGQRIVFQPLHPPEDVMVIDRAAARIGSMVSSQADHILYGGRLSPDGRWVAFTADLDKTINKKLFITALRDGHGLPEADWIPVTDGLREEREVAWSANGDRLYFLSMRDGSFCIWAQPLEPRTKEPAGKAFPVQHFHHARQSLARVERGELIGLSAARDKLVFAMSELTGNIWMEERKADAMGWLSKRIRAIPQ